MDDKTLTIKRCDNGVMLTCYPYGVDDTPIELSEVIEFEGDFNSVEENSDPTYQDGMIRFLYKVAEWAGYSYNKWSTSNLRIDFGHVGQKVATEEEVENENNG